MLPLPVLRAVSRVFPTVAPGEALHRRALAAHRAGDNGGARRWFAAAAERYRRDLAVERLARLRVHELMTTECSGGSPDVIEIVRRVNRLDRLESLAAPHALTDAREVLAEWMEQAGHTGGLPNRSAEGNAGEAASSDARAA